ncbi:ArsR/SmtB family transcription factor [Deinococcus koreensis]|uniref:ArsR/SmtB family transcription factor n=1 Tax=Deinococcus koreensis TaxID=2054903 RepID=UPI001A9DA7D7|nr:metalloregulator ArsR/SmtB family transcription factor [Deinococcus koreensis]
MYNAVAEPQRRRILALLRTGQKAASEIADALALAPSPTSKHLRVLRQVGLVSVREDGRHRHYTLNAQPLREVHAWTGGFEQFWSENFDRLEAYVEELGHLEDDHATD